MGSSASEVINNSSKDGKEPESIQQVRPLTLGEEMTHMKEETANIRAANAVMLSEVLKTLTETAANREKIKKIEEEISLAREQERLQMQELLQFQGYVRTAAGEWVVPVVQETAENETIEPDAEVMSDDDGYHSDSGSFRPIGSQ